MTPPKVVAPVPVPISSPVAMYSIKSNPQSASTQDIEYQQSTAPTITSQQQSYVPVAPTQQQFSPPANSTLNQYSNQIAASGPFDNTNSYVPDAFNKVTRPAPSAMDSNPMIGQSISNSYVPQLPSNTASQISPAYSSASSYIPSHPPARPLEPSLPAPTPTPTAMPEVDCSLILNTYWSGYKCVCKVGYISINGKCVSNRLQVVSLNMYARPAEFIRRGISSGSPDYNRNSCFEENEVYDYTEDRCMCVSGCIRSEAGKCVTKPNYQNYDNQKGNNGMYAPYDVKPFPPASPSDGPSTPRPNPPQYPPQYPQYPSNPLPSPVLIPPVVRCGANSALDEMNKCRCLPGCYANKSVSSGL